VATLKTNCPHCGQKHVYEHAYAGTVGVCMACRRSFERPKLNVWLGLAGLLVILAAGALTTWVVHLLP